MSAIMSELIYDVQKILNANPRAYASLKAKLYGDDGVLLGEHFDPLQLWLDLDNGVTVTDLFVESAGAIPVDISKLDKIEVYIG